MLPDKFCERMKADLQNEYDSFLSCYDKPPYIGLRVNTLKTSSEEFRQIVDFCSDRIDWCNDGFYYDGKKGKHPSSLAGLFYSQEPSAMIAAEILPVKEGDKLLDLCAAPGGKSTQLAAKLGGSGLIVSNEVAGSRAKILCENIERMGIKNAVVTSMYPEKMEKTFECFFDGIMVDAPCSGEGMFRKDEVAVREWSIEHTVSCSVRQLGILESAYKMLNCGGYIVYSTCTFATVENEDVCNEFIKKHPDMELIETHRLMPHKVKGEGHFSALLRKSGEKRVVKYNYPKAAKDDYIKCYRQFEKENLKVELEGRFVAYGENLYLIPESMPSLEKIKCIRPGLFLGEVRKGRFIPAHHLCVAMKKSDFKRTISLRDEQIGLYVKGEGITLNSEKGYGAMLYEDKFPLGWYKYSETTAKNHYPKYLRLL